MKDTIREIAISFFISVALINIAMLVLGLLLRPTQQFGYEVFMYPLIYGLIGVIPVVVFRTKKELSVKQVMIRKIMQLLLLIVLMLGFMFGGKPMNYETITAAIGVTCSVVVIYILVCAIEWMIDVRTAKSMTEDLLNFQNRVNRE